MNYKRYSGKKYSYSELPLTLKSDAWNSYESIVRKYLKIRKDNINIRINKKFIRDRFNSYELLNKMKNDLLLRDKVFSSNLVEFTSQGVYLNLYLED